MYIVFGNDYCPYCRKTIQLLKRKKKKYKYFDYNNNDTMVNYKDVIPQDYRFIPIIIEETPKKKVFIDGGFSSLKDILNKTKRKRRIKNNHCAPSLKNNKTSTCFEKPELLKIINSWNNYNSNEKIKFRSSDSKMSLWNKINNKFRDECDNEVCWLKKKLVNQEFKENFKPFKPTSWEKSPREWLSTIDIENVLKQYENKHKDFQFIGCVPIDFDYELYPGNCVVNELCKLNIDRFLNKQKKKIGVVFNLDKHNQSGSHWVALFCNFDKKEICYFDSYGMPAPQEVLKLIERFKIQGEERGLNMKVKINNIRHQYKNSECGVYCITFIIKLLENNSFERFCNSKIPDDKIFKNRKLFFI